MSEAVAPVDLACQAHALYFGPEGETCWGWRHPSALPQTPQLGLVLCSSFGLEDLALHRTLRHVAQAASQAGVPTLRFDYAGTGDAAGHEAHGDQLAAWVRSVHHAIDQLRADSGVRQVVVLGVRLGALVAALATLNRQDVHALVAVSPVIAGRSYLRELQMLQTATAAVTARSASETPSDGALESGGFVLNRETQAALSAVNLSKLVQPLPCDVLILPRDDFPADKKWPMALQAQGVAVSTEPLSGYVGMVANPDATVVPQAMINTLLTRLSQWTERMREAPAAMVDPVLAARPIGRSSVDIADLGVREQAIHVAGTTLVGVLTTPVSATSQIAHGAGLLLLNAGSIRRIGPSRLYVDLARRWAAQGYTVLRLDVSGVGDSASTDDEENTPYPDQAIQDVAAALAYLNGQVGAQSAVVGLCSGGYHGFKAAVAGLPIDRVVIINPLTFFWKKGMSLEIDADAYHGSMVDRSAWRKLMKGQIAWRKLFRAVWDRGQLWAVQLVRAMRQGLGQAVPDDLAAELKAVAAKGVPMHFVFSDSDPGEAMLLRGAGRTVARLLKRGQLTITRLSQADHIFTQSDARQRLIAVLDALILSSVPNSRGAQPQRHR